MRLRLIVRGRVLRIEKNARSSPGSAERRGDKTRSERKRRPGFSEDCFEESRKTRIDKRLRLHLTIDFFCPPATLREIPPRVATSGSITKR